MLDILVSSHYIGNQKNYNSFREAKMTKEEELILTTAREKFMREGFFKTTIDDIASVLKMSKKTIYKYFPSKEILVTKAVELMQLNIKSQVAEITDSSDNAVRKIFRIFEFIGKLLQKLDERALEDFRVRIPEVWEKVDKFRTKMISENFTKIINQGKEEGLIVNFPTEIIMTLYIAGIRSVINPDFVMNNRFSIDEVKNIAIDLMMNAILTEKGKEIYNKSKAGK